MADTQVFNYVDSLQSAASKQYFSNIHDTAIQQTGRRAFIYPLDKTLTQTNVYNDTLNRVYLPHFEIRALYKTNTFVQNLTLDGLYSEQEDNMEFEFNFERMVNTINELKHNKSGTLTIKNMSNDPLMIEIKNNKFYVITKTGISIIEENLLDYSSIKLFVSEMNKKYKYLKFSYKGNSEEAKSLDIFHTKLLPRRTFTIEVDDETYSNITDVIEQGYIIITDRGRIYSVTSAIPVNDNYGNEYIGWKCLGKLINMAIVDTLPNDAKQLIQKLNYGLSKIDME